MRNQQNALTADLTVNSAATSSIDFTTVLGGGATPDVFYIMSDIDGALLLKVGTTTPPAAVGSAATPIVGESYYIGPSYGPIVLHVDQGSPQIGIRNTGASNLALKVLAYQGPSN